MAHWCDYKDFAESLKWLADQDNQKIEEFLCSQRMTKSSHSGSPGQDRSSVVGTGRIRSTSSCHELWIGVKK